MNIMKTLTIKLPSGVFPSPISSDGWIGNLTLYECLIAGKYVLQCKSSVRRYWILRLYELERHCSIHDLDGFSPENDFVKRDEILLSNKGHCYDALLATSLYFGRTIT